MTDWISVEHRLPNERHGWSDTVLVTVQVGKLGPMVLLDRTHAGEWGHGCVTHWMPLPQPAVDIKEIAHADAS